MTRTDPHRPGAIVPDDYEPIAAFFVGDDSYEAYRGERERYEAALSQNVSFDWVTEIEAQAYARGGVSPIALAAARATAEATGGPMPAVFEHVAQWPA